jgi:hypothetical protein
MVVSIKKKGAVRLGQKKKDVFTSSMTKQQLKPDFSRSYVSHIPVSYAHDSLSGSDKFSDQGIGRFFSFSVLHDKKNAHSAAVSSVNHFSNIIFEFVHDHLLYAGFVLLAVSIYLFIRENPNYSIVFLVAMAIIVLQSITLLSEWLFDESRIKNGIVSPIPLPKKEDVVGVVDSSKDSGVSPDVAVVLKMVDGLARKLPKDDLERFTDSSDFRTYKRLMKKYNLK